MIYRELNFWLENSQYLIKHVSMKTILALIETFIHQLTNSNTNQKMPALIPVRVITKVNRDHH